MQRETNFVFSLYFHLPDIHISNCIVEIASLESINIYYLRTAWIRLQLCIVACGAALWPTVRSRNVRLPIIWQHAMCIVLTVWILAWNDAQRRLSFASEKLSYGGYVDCSALRSNILVYWRASVQRTAQRVYQKEPAMNIKWILYPTQWKYAKWKCCFFSLVCSIHNIRFIRMKARRAVLKKNK